MVFSDLEVVVSQVSRNTGYVRDNVFRVWTSGAGSTQKAFCRELAGALLREADEFFDRALVLYLMSSHLRNNQASTWADVAVYYSNYFCATSFMRLHLRSVTHLAGGGIFSVRSDPGPGLVINVSERARRLSHKEVWTEYYALVIDMGWPDSSSVALLSPSVGQLRFREQNFRERVNYRAGEGFSEIYLTPTRYLKLIKGTRSSDVAGVSATSMSDEAYNYHMAEERLKHVSSLLLRLRKSRTDTAIEDTFWERRHLLADRYATTRIDKRFALDILDRID
jgi:hypothetical protein